MKLEWEVRARQAEKEKGIQAEGEHVGQ